MLRKSERVYQVTTLAQTYESDAPSLASIVKLKNRKTAALIVSQELADYLSFTNIRDQPTSEQLDRLVSFIIDDHSALTTDDIKLFFHKCCNGEFGSNYNRFDGPTILQWLAKFERQLDEYLDYRREIEDNRIKDMGGTDLLDAIAENCPEDVQKHLNKLVHGISCTDDELTRKLADKQKAEDIRSSIFLRYSPLYKTRPVEEVDRIIDDQIRTELINNNLFEYA